MLREESDEPAGILGRPPPWSGNYRRRRSRSRRRPGGYGRDDIVSAGRDGPDGKRPSATPALAVCKLLGIETATKKQEVRLADEMHWLYGTTLGLGHTALEKVPEPTRSIIYMSLVWSTGATLMGATGVAPPPTDWKPQSLASDLTHHAVYTAIGAIVFNVLGRIAARNRRNIDLDAPFGRRAPCSRTGRFGAIPQSARLFCAPR